MEKSLAIIIAVTVPIAIVVFVGIVVCLIRRYLDKSRMGSVMYNRISHELDDEEMEFKRSIEMRNNDGSAYAKVDYSDGNSDEDDELYGFGLDDENGFGARDMERLNMLDKFRSNLVAGAGAALKSSNSAEDLISSNKVDVDEIERGQGIDTDYTPSKDIADGASDGVAGEDDEDSDNVTGAPQSSDDYRGSGLPGLRI